MEYIVSKNLTCFCGRVVSKIHSSTLILTCLWTSKRVLTKSLSCISKKVLFYACRFITRGYLSPHSPDPGVMELWMRSYSSELFPSCELFFDTMLSCYWSYGTLDEVLQQWTLSQSWIVPRHNTLLHLALWNSGWGPAEMNSSQSWTLPRHTITLLFVPTMDSTNIYRKKNL